jgi:hypothetical protein
MPVSLDVSSYLRRDRAGPAIHAIEPLALLACNGRTAIYEISIPAS